MTPDWSLDLSIAPGAAEKRIATAINKRAKRAFWILKIENQYIGYAHEGRFEIWEKQQRAVHAYGKVAARRGGTHIGIRFALSPLTRALLVVFFVLYAAVAVGLATQPPDTEISTPELLGGLGGAAVLVAIFRVSAKRQRADLRTFIERIFADVARV